MRGIALTPEALNDIEGICIFKKFIKFDSTTSCENPEANAAEVKK